MIVDGLFSGGDDYMAKPYRVEELEARVLALLRRVQMHRQQGEAAPLVRSQISRLRNESCSKAAGGCRRLCAAAGHFGGARCLWAIRAFSLQAPHHFLLLGTLPAGLNFAAAGGKKPPDLLFAQVFAGIL